MIKKYALDFSIERDTDRCRAIEEILDTMETDPTPTELEQMASYILYGKDENGQNAIQRSECTDKEKRYKSYNTKDDKTKSLDEMMATPGFDEAAVKSAYKRDSYTTPKPTIQRPRYDKKTGELIDPGDSEIPFMRDQWDTIDRWQRILDIAQGRLAPNESDTIISDSYRIYQLKHNLIDMRKQQYYIKDAYKPTIHFQNLDHPKTQFYDWCGDSFYWVSLEEWRDRVDHSYTTRISSKLEDYETRTNANGELEVKWIVCKHTFDWENPKHVRAFLSQYNMLFESLNEKLDTYGRTLFWDFDRYVSMCNFSELRLFFIELKKQGMGYWEILDEMRAKYAFEYSPNYLVSVISTEIPGQIARVAKKWRLELQTPVEGRKKCIHCGRLIPADPVFFSRNNSHKDKLSSTCKECDRANRIRRGVIRGDGDHRKKDPTLHKMQTRETT